MKRMMITAIAVAIASSGMSQSLALQYAVNSTNSGGTSADANAQALDLSTSRVLSSAYSATAPTLYRYNAATGAADGFTNFTHDPGSPTAGALAGFSVGCASDGTIFYYDQFADPLGRIQRLDSSADTQGAIVSDTITSFSRNLKVEGSGADTWILSVGTGDSPNAIGQLLKATDASRTSFTKLATIAGASLTPVGFSKSGGAISPPDPGQPPQYVVGGDVVGLVQVLRLFEYVGPLSAADSGYVLRDEETTNPVDVAIDTGVDESGKQGAVFALMAPSGTRLTAIQMYTLTANDTLVAGPYVELPTVNAVTVRGTLMIDRANNTVVAAYRGATSPTVVIALAKYTLANVPPTAAHDWALYE